MIEAFRLGVRARGGTLWDGLDFAFDDGSAWVITGPPSSGKTVLLSILRGERRPDAGDVLVSGESIYRGSEGHARSFRASCGFVPERIDPGARLTVNGLFQRSAMLCGSLRAEERSARSERLLSMVGLPGIGEERLSVLSVSERVRASLAAELLVNPRVLFADGAVLSAGAAFAEMLGGLFRALAGAGITVLAAERELPAQWAAFAGRGQQSGPFMVYRLLAGAAKGGVS